MPLKCSIEVAPAGHEPLLAIKDKKVLREIAKVIDGLAESPETQGKALLSPFERVRSIRAVRSRYRILYRVDSSKRTVSILLVGRRQPGEEGDIYAVAERLLKALLGGESE